MISVPRFALRSNPSNLLGRKVVRLDLVSDSVTEERIAQIAFDTLPTGISVGELAEVTLKLPTTQARFVVPNASLKRLNDQLGVWLYQEGKARFIAVKTGQSSKEINADSRLKIVESLAEAGK